jgi:hypothetical protein
MKNRNKIIVGISTLTLVIVMILAFNDGKADSENGTELIETRKEKG